MATILRAHFFVLSDLNASTKLAHYFLSLNNSHCFSTKMFILSGKTILGPADNGAVARWPFKRNSGYWVYTIVRVRSHLIHPPPTRALLPSTSLTAWLCWFAQMSRLELISSFQNNSLRKFPPRSQSLRLKKPSLTRHNSSLGDSLQWVTPSKLVLTSRDLIISQASSTAVVSSPKESTKLKFRPFGSMTLSRHQSIKQQSSEESNAKHGHLTSIFVDSLPPHSPLHQVWVQLAIHHSQWLPTIPYIDSLAISLLC